MKYAVIKGGYEEFRRLEWEEIVEFLGYEPVAADKFPDDWGYDLAFIKQRRERRERHCDRVVVGSCVVLRPNAFKSKSK
jgi:hypothetical protein